LNKYDFCSERLGFRNWRAADIALLHEINSDPIVMEYFPALPALEETTDLVRRMQKMYAGKRYCYFAVDLLDNNRFIGFIGLSDQHYQSPFTPCVDIGWRIHKDYWGMGLATEGAQKCIDYAFNVVGLNQVRSIAPKANLKSIRVMEKIGMEYLGSFKHPKLEAFPLLENCVCYEISYPDNLS
jgi:RimJ/RimL family protein N-acetyltransferase